MELDTKKPLVPGFHLSRPGRNLSGKIQVREARGLLYPLCDLIVHKQNSCPAPPIPLTPEKYCISLKATNFPVLGLLWRVRRNPPIMVFHLKARWNSQWKLLVTPFIELSQLSSKLFLVTRPACRTSFSWPRGIHYQLSISQIITRCPASPNRLISWLCACHVYFTKPLNHATFK